jgi:hypothetical protein
VERDTALAGMEWLSLPDGFEQFLEFVGDSLAKADADGLVDHALVTSESANLCAKAFLELSGVALKRKAKVFDSICPEAIDETEAGLKLRQTLFILANKERYALKDHCLFLYFHEKLQAIEGTGASRHFVTETESHSYLASPSREYTFRDLVHDPPAIPAAYFSLRQFGAVLVGMHAAETETIVRTVREARRVCSQSDPPSLNPALQVGAFLSSAIADRKGYLAILTSPSLNTYVQRLGQLLGGCLARESSGLLPVLCCFLT